MLSTNFRSRHRNPRMRVKKKRITSSSECDQTGIFPEHPLISLLISRFSSTGKVVL